MKYLVEQWQRHLIPKGGGSISAYIGSSGALCARTAVMGAFLNVKINAARLDDKAFVEGILAEGKAIEDKAIQEEKEILEIVNGKI